jgi:hypothetical protein
MASSSAPQRNRASVAFGLRGLKSWPAGSAPTHSTPFPRSQPLRRTALRGARVVGQRRLAWIAGSVPYRRPGKAVSRCARQRPKRGRPHLTAPRQPRRSPPRSIAPSPRATAGAIDAWTSNERRRSPGRRCSDSSKDAVRGPDPSKARRCSLRRRVERQPSPDLFHGPSGLGLRLGLRQTSWREALRGGLLEEPEKSPFSRHFLRRRDPDSNRGHHDFQQSLRRFDRRPVGFRTSFGTSREVVARSRSAQRRHLRDKGGDLQGLLRSGETRTRTGDTTIFQGVLAERLRRQKACKSAVSPSRRRGAMPLLPAG